MERLNLHLTGDFHAITAAHNLLAAVVDNDLHHGSAVGLDPRSVTWRRVMDVNDRSLRNVVIGLGARMDGVPRESGFDITASSEVMAILTLSTSPGRGPRRPATWPTSSISCWPQVHGSGRYWRCAGWTVA